MLHFYPILRSNSASVRSPVRLGRTEPFRTRSRRSRAAIRHHARRVVRTLFPALFALSLASAAHSGSIRRSLWRRCSRLGSRLD